MRIDSINGTHFESKPKICKQIKNLCRDSVYTSLEPVKNYTQYLKAYGLNKSTKKIQNIK